MEKSSEIYQGAGFMDVNGKKEQIGIGEIKKLEDGSLEVEVLVGCSKEALLETMRKIAKENNKEVRAVFGEGEEIVVKPPIDKFSKVRDFIDIKGRKEQIGIGEIKRLKRGGIEVEVLAGCSKEALLETMRKIAKENNDVVTAAFGEGKGNERIIIKPEDVADLDQGSM